MYYKPLHQGYTYNSYLPQSEAEKWCRANVNNNLFHLMLATLIIPDDAVEQLPSHLSYYTIPDTLPTVDSLAIAHRATVCSRFQGTSNGFSADISLTHEDIIFFSVPCDRGFTYTHPTHTPAIKATKKPPEGGF